MDRTSTRAVASAGDGSAEGDRPKQQQPNGTAPTAINKKPPKRSGVVALVEDAVALVLAILVLLNFASAAFIEAVCYCAFNWWWPKVRADRDV